jgi:pilus assembly protein CpaF
VRRQIAHGLDVIVQLEQLPDGSRRVTRVTEVGDVGDDGQVQLRDIFRFVETGRGAGGRIDGRFEATGVVPWFHGKFELAGAPVPESTYSI